jgi:putative ABC transport system substrate-binding protein
MTKKILIWLLATFLLTPDMFAGAQQAGKIPRIGYLAGFGDAKNPGPQIEAFRQGLRELGYVEGKNILVEYRYIEGMQERIPILVAELVRLKVDMLVIPSSGAIREAKRVTKTIPIVMIANFDPVAAGIVDSLARPGANITGLDRMTRELSDKRLGLFKEAVPKALRVGVLWDVDQEGATNYFKEYEISARAQNIPLQSLEVRGPKPDIEMAFKSAIKGRVNALIVVRSPKLRREAKRILELVIKYRLPCMCEGTDFVEAGCMMSYSTSDTESFRRAATYVDKIIKGRKPADLPVERPMKFEFVINLKTAKQIGLNIPQSVLFRADRVIQ